MEKVKTIIIFILLFANILLGYFVITNNKECNVTDCKKEKEITVKGEKNSIVGEYEGTNEDEMPLTVTIDLMEDNTFYMKETKTMSTIYYGNYTVNGNTISLHKTYSHSNAQGVAAKLDETIQIQIVDNNLKYNDITLEKNNKTNDIKVKLMEYIANDTLE